MKELTNKEKIKILRACLDSVTLNIWRKSIFPAYICPRISALTIKMSPNEPDFELEILKVIPELLLIKPKITSPEKGWWFKTKKHYFGKYEGLDVLANDLERAKALNTLINHLESLEP